MIPSGSPQRPNLSPRRFADLSRKSAYRYVRRLIDDLMVSLRNDHTPAVPYINTILDTITSDEKFSAGSRTAAKALRSYLITDDGNAHQSRMDETRRRATVLSERLAADAGVPIDRISVPVELPHPHRAHEYDDGTSPAFVLPVVVYIPHIRSPFNLGNIIRTAAAFGVIGVVIGRDCPDTHHPRFLRAAMGAERMVNLRRGDLRDAGTMLSEWVAEEASVPIIVLETGGQNAYETQLPSAGILVIGHEELGVAGDVFEATEDVRVLTIPHRGAKASLNVGVATGIALALWDAGDRARK